MKLLRTILVALFLCFTFGGTACAAPLTCTVTGTVYKTDGVTPYAGGYITFRPTTTQTFTPDTVAIPSIRVTLDVNGAIPAGTTLVQGERLLVSVGNDTARAVTVPSGASCPVLFSDLYGAVQVPPPAGIVHSVTVSATGDTGLSVSPTTGDVVITFGPALAGVHTNGSDTISNFSVNNIQNVKAWGATGSTTTATATTTATNAVITVNAIGDFKVGQHIKIDHAGAASDATLPTGLTVQPQSYLLNPNPTSTITNNGCQTDATTAVGHNTSCAVNHTYAIVGVSVNGGWSAPTANVSTAVGPQTLSPNNNILVSWTGKTADIAYLVYACQGAACTPTLKAVVPHHGAAGNTAQSYRDFGSVTAQDETFGTTMQAGAVAQDLLTTITNISGTTVTLNAAPSVTGSEVMRHDDAPPIQAAIDDLCTHIATGGVTNGTIYFPGPTTYPIGQTISLYGCYGTGLQGSGPTGQGAFASMLQWHGPTGGTLLNMNRTADSRIASLGMGISSGAGNQPGVCIDSDKFNTGGGGDSVSVRHNSYEDLEIDNCSIGIRLQNVGTANNENNIFENVSIDNSGTGKGGIFGLEVGGSGQTYSESYVNGEIWGYDIAVLSDFAGQLSFNDADFEQNKIVLWTSNRFGGEADGGITFSDGTLGLSGGYAIYDAGGGEISHATLHNMSILGGAGPNGFVINSDRRLLIEHTHVCENAEVNCFIANSNETISLMSSYSASSPFRDGDGANKTDPDAAQVYTEIFDVVNNSGTAFNVWNKVHAPKVDACNNMGTVAINTTISFDHKTGCQKLSTATTGLTYTLSTTNVIAGEQIEIDSYITGAIVAGPLWATSSGAIRWAGGVAPVSSTVNGQTDILRLKWDGTNWQEISRSMGNS